MDSKGNLYGSASGGSSHNGMIFELKQGSSSLTTLASFPSGTTLASGPSTGALVRDSQGNLYGTGAGGKGFFGTIFELNAKTGQVNTLASFNGTNGYGPRGSPLFDSHGDIFGTTFNGGSTYILNKNPGDGTIFELAANSNMITTLASFDHTQGTELNPDGGLVMDSQGDFFGTTRNGGKFSDGTLFELPAHSHTILTLVNFDGSNDGANPKGGLIMDSLGNIYGTTSAGGTNNQGTLFKFTPSPATPEPASLTLIGLGIACLAAQGWRQRKGQSA